MKRILLLIGVIWAGLGTVRAQLDSIKNQMDNQGVFGRFANLQIVDPVYPESKTNSRGPEDERNQQNIRDTLTFDFLRIYALRAETSGDKQIYVGKAFLSNRHLLGYARKSYASIDSLKEEQIGTYMMCKLYENQGKAYLNLYPQYILNVCDKTIHTGLRCKNLSDHFYQLMALVCQADMEHKDYTDRNNTLFGKYIKCFEIDISDGKIRGLELAYTKNPFSDDRLGSVKYRFDFRPFKNLLGFENEAFDLGILEPYLANNTITPNPTETQDLLAFELAEKRVKWKNAVIVAALSLQGNSSTMPLPPSRLELSDNWTVARADTLPGNPNSNEKWFFAGNLVLDNNGKQALKDTTVRGLSAILQKTPQDDIVLTQNVLVRPYCPSLAALGYQLAEPVNALKKNTRVNVLAIKQIPYGTSKAIWLRIQ